MVSNPQQWVEPMAKAGASQFTFHYEAVDGDANVNKLIDQIKANNLKAGISIKPETTVILQ
jgi:ribulose-phosphate 3-epimerase